MNRWRKLIALSWPDRRQLVWAAALLGCARLGLPFIDFRAAPGATPRARPPVPSEAGLGRAQNLARLVNIAAAHSPFAVACLHRSLVLWWLLQREDIACDLWLGVRTDAGPFGAHAWIQCGEVALGEDPAHLARFSPFGEPVVPVIGSRTGRLAMRRVS